ncbi:helicase-associated domain-containing protein [Actinotalea sp.]|uniref:helicase-associated domain-containing protein n=1 Tax=Actinotalea sp. TaxID=1872145 RepID=UPI003561B9CA
MSTYTEHLRALGPEGLARLLDARPDLATPPPGTVRALAARATTRASLERALADLDAATLATLEAVLALTSGDRSAEDGGPTVADLSRALGLEAGSAVAHGTRLGLLWGAGRLRAAPGLADTLGPHPAGLGPALPSEDEPDAPDLSDRAVVLGLLDEAPPGARAVLDALTWGPPVGRAPSEPGPARSAVAWLLRHHLLVRGDLSHVLMPREVALALRDGRTVRVPPEAPSPEAVPVDADAVDAGSVHQALDAVRLVAALLTSWGGNPPPVLRSGALGARELRRLALELETTPEVAALMAEVAGAAGLVVDDEDDPPSFCPTSAVEEWAALPVEERWAALGRAWLDTDRAAWLVGTRDDRGALRGALDPTTRRPWVRRMRRAVLQVLADTAPPGRLSATQIHEVLAWRAPRSAPGLHAVEATLAEAETLGVLSSGTLTGPGRALLSGEPHVAAVALAGLVPEPVDEVLLQADLTGIVPGLPSQALAEVLDLTATVESRGAGLTVRFSAESVRPALDAGWSGQDTLAALAAHTRGTVPQPLEYLILDAARRHGQVRAGAALSYLRAEPAALVGAADDPALRDLGLRQLAPGVLVAQVPAAELVSRLRSRGVPAVLEDEHGVVLREQVPPRRVRVPRARAVATPDPAVTRRHLLRVARDLLSSEPEVTRAAGSAATAGAAEHGEDPSVGTAGPLEALALLREAVADHRTVVLEIAGPNGSTTRRVRPVLVDAGRVRAVDAERESELTIAVHRIVRATFEGDA